MPQNASQSPSVDASQEWERESWGGALTAPLGGWSQARFYTNPLKARIRAEVARGGRRRDTALREFIPTVVATPIIVLVAIWRRRRAISGGTISDDRVANHVTLLARWTIRVLVYSRTGSRARAGHWSMDTTICRRIAEGFELHPPAIIRRLGWKRGSGALRRQS